MPLIKFVKHILSQYTLGGLDAGSPHTPVLRFTEFAIRLGRDEVENVVVTDKLHYDVRTKLLPFRSLSDIHVGSFQDAI